MALPTAEQLAYELMTNYKLSIVLARLKVEETNDWGGMDILDGHGFKFDWAQPRDSVSEPEEIFDGNRINQDEKVAMVPYLRRLGYSVLFFNDFDGDTFSVNFPGHASKKRELLRPRPHWGEHLYARTFCQARMWGVIRCVVKLKALAKRARAIVRAKPGGVDFLLAQQEHASSGAIGM